MLKRRKFAPIRLPGNVGGFVMFEERDIDKESEMLRESKIYEEESGLLEEDKI